MAESLGRYRKLYAIGVIEGRRINAVSMEAECWLWRLQLIADDYGNLPADVDIIRGRAAPKRKITPGKIRKLNAELVASGLIVGYESEGEGYYHCAEFERMQTSPNGRMVQRYPEYHPSGGIQLNPGNPVLPSNQPETSPRPARTRDQPEPEAAGPGAETSPGRVGSGLNPNARAGGSARMELEHLGVSADMAKRLARAGVTADEVRRTIAETRADRRVKSPVRAMISRLAEAHQVQLKGGKAVGEDARALQATIDARQRA